MIIRLNEIPENGRDYAFDRKTAELNPVLMDLIQNKDYTISLFIKPMNSKDFELTGSINTCSPSQCSICAEDFDLELKREIREILIPNQELDRTGKYAKSTATISADEDETYSVSQYSKQQYDLGEFLHEAIALEIPFKPLCANCNKPGSELFIYDEKMGEEEKPNPFQALKGIKIN